MNCQNCGAPLPEGAKFCKKCGTEVPEQAKEPRVIRFFAGLWEKLSGNRTLLYAITGGLLLLTVALIVVIGAVSCSHHTLKTPEDVADAVVTALEKGDGDALCALAKTAEPLLGRHPEQFGEGDTPEAVMLSYYRTLAGDLRNRLTQDFGKGFALEAQLTSELVTGSGVFEPNRALNVEAEQYAVLTGPLTVDGGEVGTLRLVAVLLNGEWKLLIVYVY